MAWFEEGNGYCGKCLRQVVVRRQRINHLAHLALTLLTGFWVIFWIREAKKVYDWHCCRCGAKVYRIMK